MAHSPLAMVVEKAGNSPVLQSLEYRSTPPGSLRIRVKACALNFADLLMMEGRYQDTPAFPLVPGMEISGEILEVGDSVAGFTVGDQVVSYCGHGGLAEETVVAAKRCLLRPETMDDVTGAAFPIAYGTSHLALVRRAALQAGERLLVLGAGGGVGLTAVELGAALGAEVVAVARGAEKLAAAQQAGALHLIDSAETDDLRRAVLETGPTHVVYDAVGGVLGAEAARTLEPEGRHLLIGFASGDVPALKLNHMLVKNITVIGFNFSGYMAFNDTALTESLCTLMDWHGKGRISPHVSQILPLDRAVDGLEMLRQRKSTGKIVITP